MTNDGNAYLSRRAIIGTAGSALAIPLIGDRAVSAMQAGGSVPARPLQSLQELASPDGAGGVGTRLGSLSSLIGHLPLDARAHGVIGDGRTDDTRAAQAFLDLCAAQGGRIAHFGSLSVRITGPLTSRGVGIVFDPAGYGARGAPGFVAEGSGYTALTVVGSVADFCVTVAGAEGADITEAGRIDRDRRPRINGIAFGTQEEPFGMSTVRSVRVNSLAGFGVRHDQCWDSLFLSVSLERCGREDAYAFEVVGSAQRSCNETTWARVQVEQSIGCAMRIDPGTLSCTFAKIHSERAIARGSAPTWFFGGSCVYDSVRLHAANPDAAGATIVSNQADFRNLRAEGVLVTVNASGGTINFHTPGAALQSAPNQSGIINVVGGVVSVHGMGPGWNLVGCQVNRLEVGFMPEGLRSTLTGCAVSELAPHGAATQGEIVLVATRVASATLSGAGRLRAMHLCNGSDVAGKGGTLFCEGQTVTLDASSRISGHLTLQRASLRLAGSVTGNLVVNGAVHDARAADGASIGGSVSGWGAPTVPAGPGAWSVNLAAATGRAGQIVAGWRYVAGGWRSVRMNIGD